MMRFPIKHGTWVQALATACFTIFTIHSSNASVLTNGCAYVRMSCTLDELLQGGELTVNELLFSDRTADDFSSNPVDTTAIDVLPLDGEPTEGGITFDANDALSTS